VHDLEVFSSSVVASPSAAGLITGILRLSQNEANQLRSAPAYLIAGGKSQGKMTISPDQSTLSCIMENEKRNGVKRKGKRREKRVMDLAINEQ
jgi:hypothetical protein